MSDDPNSHFIPLATVAAVIARDLEQHFTRAAAPCDMALAAYIHAQSSRYIRSRDRDIPPLLLGAAYALYKCARPEEI